MSADLAAVNLFRLVREFSLRAPLYIDVIRYQTNVDERYDLTLASARVYGNRNEALVIQAAAGMDSPEQILEEQLLTLPPPQTLRQMKEQAGYVVNGRT